MKILLVCCFPLFLSAKPSFFNNPVNSYDITTAKMIVDIYTNLEQDKVDKNSILLTIKRTHKSHAFQYFRPHLKKLLAMSKARRINKSIKVCTFENDTLLISHTFYQKIKNFCYKNILNRLIKHKYYKRSNRQILRYLGQNMKYYLLEDNIGDFLKYLKNIKKESALYFSLSRIVREGYIKYRYKIHPEILSTIHINSSFTSYVDTNNLAYLNEAGSLDKEFYQIEKNIHDNFKKNNIFQAKKSANIFIGFHKQNAHLMESPQPTQALLNVGKKFFRENIFDTSYDINRYIFISSKGAFKEQAAFEILFNFIRRKKYKEAVKAVNSLKILENFEFHKPKLKYWTAFTIKKYGQEELANTLYKKLVRFHPMSFYAIVAFKENPSLLGKNTFVKKIKVKKDISSLNKHDKGFLYSLKRLKIWSKIENTAFISKELESILQYINGNPKKFHKNDIQSIVFGLGKDLNTRGKYLYTFQLINRLLANNKIDLNQDILTLLFPRPYFKNITQYNSKIDPHLILALIRQESAFNPKAVSSAGATGLMQLMPATAKRFKKDLKLKLLNRSELNIKIGISYLDYLIKKYNGNLIYFLAGYNAGENRVKQWSREIFNTKDPLITIEMIPFSETRNYVKLVYRNLFFYKYISDEDSFVNKGLNKSFFVKV